MRYGEIVELGRHRLMCGDATIRDDVMRLVDGKTVDLVLTDPPYSSGGLRFSDKRKPPSVKYQMTGTRKSYPEYTHDNMDGHSWGMFNHIWHTVIIPHMNNGAYLLQFTDYRQLPITIDTLQTSGLTYRGIIVWDKRGGRPQKGLFRQQCEFIAYGTKGKYAGSFILPGMYSIHNNPAEKMHVVGKPVELMLELIKCVSENAIVLDCFGGSGTTLIACEMTGRKCFMMEISPEYCDIIRRRYEKLTEGKLPLEVVHER